MMHHGNLTGLSSTMHSAHCMLMERYLLKNQEKYKNILLVFPTVALLRENALNMEELNQDKKMGPKPG